jgi:cysteinyl-tRNA synthetase
MSTMDLESLSLGKTVDLADYVKDNPKDFTLLKRATLQDLKEGECLQTQWGNVRPSWFVQLAATAMDHLPELTVFMVGESQRFPHLENFRAIWSLGKGWEPQAWTICQPVMGPAQEEGAPTEEGGAAPLTLPEHDIPGVVRMWLLSTSLHKSLSLTPRSLAMWEKNWRRVQSLAVDLREAAAPPESSRPGAGGPAPGPEVQDALEALEQGFRRAMENDLALHRFWPVIFGFCRDLRQYREDGRLSPEDARAALDGLRAVDKVLRILDESRMPVPRRQWPAEAVELVERRRAAREDRDFARADELRDELGRAGFRVEDTPAGPRLYRTG